MRFGKRGFHNERDRLYFAERTWTGEQFLAPYNVARAPMRPDGSLTGELEIAPKERKKVARISLEPDE